MIRKNKLVFKPFINSTMKSESKINRDTREFFKDKVDKNLIVKKKKLKADLKLQHKKIFEISLAVTLVLLIAMAHFARQFSFATESINRVDLKIEIADIPVTEQFRKPPPPPRPSIPIPTEEESIPEDVTIASTEIDLSDIPPPPLNEGEELLIFVAYDEAPKIIGGIAELQKHIKYPRLAVQAGIEGIVFVKVLVGINGIAEQIKIIKAKPAKLGFEEAAINALKKVEWEPAKQRDKIIRVWISIPVRFKLAS
ncbi:MAG: energy transducer TonB [bacterium]